MRHYNNHFVTTAAILCAIGVCLAIFVSPLWAQATEEQEDVSPSEDQYDKLYKRLIDRGVEVELARREVERVRQDHEKRRSELDQQEVERNKPIAFTDPADMAFKAAMDKDLSRGVGEGRTQMGAVRAWEELVKRKDISEQQRLYATWRMGCLFAGNFDPDRGEKPDFVKSEKLLQKAMNMVPGLLCRETLNSSTLYATHPGTELEKAERLAESYRFIETASQESRAKSVARINKNGFALDKKFFSLIARLDPATEEQKKQWLDKAMQNSQTLLEECVTGFFERCRDEVAAKRLLLLLEDFADPVKLEEWREIRSSASSEWASEKAALASLEDIKTRSIKSGTNQTMNPPEKAAKSSATKPLNSTRESTTTSERKRSRSVLIWIICGLGALLGAVGILFCCRSPRRRLL